MNPRTGGPHIGLIVEGPGDKGALPILLRAYLHSKGEYANILGKPIPLKGKGAATTQNGIEGYVLAAARPNCKGVIVLLDADDDHSCELGPSLLGRVESLVQVPVVVAIAERDFEDWIYASVETLGFDQAVWATGQRGQAKIRELLAPEKYIKATMQAKFTSRINLDLARERNPSLDRLFKKIDGLLERFD